MEIIVEIVSYNGQINSVSARKLPSDSYTPDESDPTVTEFVVELDDYTKKDEQQYLSYCNNIPRKWSKTNLNQTGKYERNTR